MLRQMLAMSTTSTPSFCIQHLDRVLYRFFPYLYYRTTVRGGDPVAIKQAMLSLQRGDGRANAKIRYNYLFSALDALYIQVPQHYPTKDIHIIDDGITVRQ